MDSRLAVAQTSSSSSVDDQNESKPLDESGPKVLGGQTDKTSASTLATSLQLFPITPVTSRQVSSTNGDTSKRASQKPCKSQDGPKQPIIVKTGTPVLNNQPIRIKIIVRGKNPIISTAPTSLTKELCPSEFTKSAPGPPETAPLAGGKTAGETPCPRPPSAITNERPAEEAVRPTAEDTKAGSFDGAEGNGGTERTTEDARDDGDDDADRQQDSSTTTADPSPISDERLRLNGATATPPEDPRPAGEPGADREEVTLPLDLHKVDLEAVRGQVEVVEEVEEQTEPLDLSLPRSNRDADGRRWEDSGCESSLIMEVDEFEGEGDRDVVEEDDDDDADEDADDGDGADEDREVVRNVTPAYGATHADSFCDSILSPSFFSTSVFASLSSIDSDHDEFLFIDDQGIPYNLSPEGHKVPQIDTSKLDGGPLSGRPVAQPRSNHGQGEEPSQLVTLLASNLGQSLGNPSHAVIAPRDNLLASSQTSVSPPQSAEPSQAAELSTCALATKTPEFSEAAAPCQTSPGETGGVLPGNQTVQILSNPSGNTPILLLSSPSPAPAQFPSSPMGLSLPLSIARSPAPSSTPMLLLLSTVSSSAGPSLALLDPSTGQLSQITAASAGPLSFPALSAGQLGKPGSALLSYPMFQLGASNASVVLSGVGNNLTTKLVPLTSSSSSISTITPPTPQTSNLIPSAGALCKGAPPGPSQTGVSDTHVEAEVISKEGNTKPSPSTSGSPPPLLNYDLTFDTLDPLSPQADPSSGSDPGVVVDPSAVLPDDHLYFSSMGGPPSPSIFTSSQLDAMDPLDPLDSLDPLDPLDPLSPSSSPNSLGPRKILYCQLCPRVFFYSSDLERHAITHSQKKPHVCQQCGKAFKRSSHLQRHKHIHTGQRNYVCPICAKRFREAGELQRHQRVHTGEKPYQCQLCHTRFAERNTLRRHTKRKHPYHQVAMEMLQERRRGAGSGGGRDDDDDGDGDGGGGGGRGGGIQMQQEEEEDEEERAEWYSSAVSRLEDAESYMET